MPPLAAATLQHTRTQPPHPFLAARPVDTLQLTLLTRKWGGWKDQHRVWGVGLHGAGPMSSKGQSVLPPHRNFNVRGTSWDTLHVLYGSNLRCLEAWIARQPSAHISLDQILNRCTLV